jgi:hypothetical protein
MVVEKKESLQDASHKVASQSRGNLDFNKILSEAEDGEDADTVMMHYNPCIGSLI